MRQGPKKRAETFENVSTANLQERGGGEREFSSVPALTILSHPMPHRVGERLLLEGLMAGEEVSLSRNGPDFVRPGGSQGKPLADPFVSRKPLRLIPLSQGRLRLEPSEGSRVTVDGRPLLEPEELGPAALVAGVALGLAERVLVLLHQADPSSNSAPDALGMVGVSTGLHRVRRRIEQVADLSVPVLVRGETGSGKELIAQALHRHGPRRDKPFVSVNLGAIPKELAAAELFGARKGAFTGAVKDQRGFFLSANGGTLFLDEVGEAPAEVQVMLLRVLETGEFHPVGAHEPVKVDVRLIAATDAHLEEQIEEGRFKAPLLHRLAGFTIRVPPLRERKEDIGLLFHHFARQELEAVGEAHRLSPEDAYAAPWLPPSLAVRLVRYHWPGNLRQLRNVARQLVIASRGLPSLRLDAQLEQELGLPLSTPAASASPELAAPTAPAAPEPKRRKASEVTEAQVLAALRETGWDLQPAADRLGIPRASIYDLVARFPNIRTAGRLSPEEISRCHRECQGNLDAMVRRLEVSRRALARRVKELGLDEK